MFAGKEVGAILSAINKLRLATTMKTAKNTANNNSWADNTPQKMSVRPRPRCHR
jgi:hypothetical protein